MEKLNISIAIRKIKIIFNSMSDFVLKYCRSYLESAIFKMCMISTFILLSFESK